MFRANLDDDQRHVLPVEKGQGIKVCHFSRRDIETDG